MRDRRAGVWRGLFLGLVLVAGCTRAEPAARTPLATPASFYFVQLTDTHWGARDGIALTRRVVEMINDLPVKVEFVAVTGDLFSDSIRREEVVAEAVEVMKGLKVPVYYVPGNHDVLKEDVARTHSLFEKHFGPASRIVEVRGWTCLFLCTEMPEGETRSPGQVQREWVEAACRKTGGRKPVLLFMHRPPVRDMLNGSDGEVSWGDPYDTRWEDLFGRCPEIKAVFAGHFHRDELCWVGAVPVYVAASLARFWDRQPSFRLYEVRRGQVNYWELYPDRKPAASGIFTLPKGRRTR